MTLPIERARSLRWGWELLWELKTASNLTALQRATILIILDHYFNNSPSHPVILGSLYSSKRAPPYPLAPENNIKAIVTRSKSKIEFDEEGKAVTVTTPGNNKIVISDKGRSIQLHDQNDNKVELTTSGISLTSPKDITVSAKGKISLDAVGAVSIKSAADILTMGLNVTSEAQVAFTAKGSASAELSAAGQTVVKGAMVMIN